MHSGLVLAVAECGTVDLLTANFHADAYVRRGRKRLRRHLQINTHTVKLLIQRQRVGQLIVEPG